jgi:hypothetical protein
MILSKVSNILITNIGTQIDSYGQWCSDNSLWLIIELLILLPCKGLYLCLDKNGCDTYLVCSKKNYFRRTQALMDISILLKGIVIK